MDLADRCRNTEYGRRIGRDNHRTGGLGDLVRAQLHREGFRVGEGVMRYFGLIMILVGTPTIAQDLITTGSTDYSVSCNSNGYVLSAPEGTEILYLGRSCDAFNADLGAGRWCWANGGVSVQLDGGSRGFPRQELSCPAIADLGLECGCWKD